MLLHDSTYMLFIGSNKFDSMEDQEELLTNILDKHADGWTLGSAHGSWKGEHEMSWVAVINDNEGTIARIIKDIKHTLDQDSVGMLTLPEMTFV